MEYLCWDARNDSEFRDAFLLTYDGFGSAQSLKEALVARLRADPGVPVDAKALLEQEEKQAETRLRTRRSSSITRGLHASSEKFVNQKLYIISLLKSWLWSYPDDFSGDDTELFESLSKELPKKSWKIFCDDSTYQSMGKHRYTRLLCCVYCVYCVYCMYYVCVVIHVSCQLILT